MCGAVLVAPLRLNKAARGAWLQFDCNQLQNGPFLRLLPRRNAENFSDCVGVGMQDDTTTRAERGGYREPGGTRELLRIAWPLVLSNSFLTLQITLDRVLLSHRGSDDVAASLPAAMLFWAPMTLLQFTASYATTFVAQYTGAGLPHRVGPAVWQALHFAVASGVAF